MLCGNVTIQMMVRISNRVHTRFEHPRYDLKITEHLAPIFWGEIVNNQGEEQKGDDISNNQNTSLWNICGIPAVQDASSSSSVRRYPPRLNVQHSDMFFQMLY